MPSDEEREAVAVFDLGGTWFRWGRYTPSGGLLDSERAPAINYLSHPELTAEDLQRALADFILRRTRELRETSRDGLRIASIAVGAPINAHDETILGSGPLWGPTAKPFQLGALLRSELPDLQWKIVNDITAMLAPYMHESTTLKKTLLVTISTGIGGRLYDHRARRVPVDPLHGIQGEIGHLVSTFELDGKVIGQRCDCGGWNHLNAFSSGRGIARLLQRLPSLSSNFSAVFSESPIRWEQADNDYRLAALKSRLEEHNSVAVTLLDSLVTPVSRALAAALTLDPEIDRIVITGGVAQGLGRHYRESLQRVFERDGLYQITERDPHYLQRRLHWEEQDDLGGLRGAGIYAAVHGLRGIRQ